MAYALACMVFFNTTMRCVRPEHVGNCSTRPRTSKPRTPNRVEPVAPVPSHSHVAAFYCVQGLRRALRYRPRRHRARCHRARRPLLLLSLAWPPPPFRASAVAPRCLALHRVWVRLCGRCGVTVLVCCIRPPAFSIALPAPAIAWACTAARQCCRMNGRSKRGRAPGCRARMCLACGAICLKYMSKANV